MSNVTQRIGPLVGGVSQAPSHMRASEYASALVNALIHPTQGITKRPGTKHIAKLANSNDGHYDTAMLFPFTASDKRRYFVSLNDGAIRVVEADTGVERTVVADAAALAYLSGIGAEDRPFSAAVAGDQLLLVNRAKVVKKGTATSAPARQPEALVAVRAADYGTTYTITLDGVQASFTTVDGSAADARNLISTDMIAANIAQVILRQPGRQAYDIQCVGSVIYISRLDGGPFTLTVSDGLADLGLSLCYGTVKAGLDLPATGVVEGFTVQVQGDPSTGADDYWMRWDGKVWRECARPGSLVSLDASTLPHALELGGALHDGLIVPAPPTAPSVAEGVGVATPIIWDDVPTGAVGVTVASGSLTLTNNGSHTAPIAPAAGLTGRLDVRFDFGVPVVAPGTRYAVARTDTPTPSTVKLYLKRGGVETLLGSQDFDDPWLNDDGTQKTGVRRTAGAFAVTQQYNAGDTLRLELVTAGVDASSPYYKTRTLSVVSTGPLKGEDAGVLYTETSASQAVFPNVDYPGAAVASVTADGVEVTHTVADAGESGAAIVAALVAAWPAGNVHAADMGNGVLKLWNTSTGTPPDVTASVTADAEHTLWVPVGGLVAGSIVGLRFINLTTGASGLVTANTAGTITVDALAGGSSSTLREGDFIRIAQAADTFAFTPLAWEDRKAGDDASNPFPSFIGRTIGNIGVSQNRLVLTAGEYVTASGAGKFGRFFRSTTQQVLDSDPIDVRGVASQGLPYWHMVDWNGAPHLFNGRSLYAVLAGDNQVLTPRTVSIQHIYELSSNERCSPVVVGRTLFVARVKNAYTQLLALAAAGQGVGVDSVDTTQAVPEYLKGSPVLIAADADAPLVIVTEDAGVRYLYAAQPVDAGRSVLYAWATWQLDSSAEPIAASMEGGDVVLMLKRPDGVYLESVDTLAHLT